MRRTPHTTKVVDAHGGDGNGEAIAHEIPGVRLLVLEDVGTAIPAAAADAVAEAMFALGQRDRSRPPHRLGSSPVRPSADAPLRQVCV